MMSPNKRFKREITSLERLPNELFLEIFQYLSSVDAVCAFAHLNRRFRSVIRASCYSFDFQAISKGKLNYVTRSHDVHCWKSLRLSDSYQTQGQVSHFSGLFSWSEHFSQLEHLSIVQMKPQLSEVRFTEFNALIHLVSLSLGAVCGKSLPILELPALKHLTIHSCLHCHWMQKLNQLVSLQHTIEHSCTHENALTWPSSLKRLNVSFEKPEHSAVIRASLSSLCQLTDLSIYESAWENPVPNGQVWQTLITDSMPLLRRFQFCFKFWRSASSAMDVTGILSTFSTPFYLEEKRWFIQCDINHLYSSKAMLYSLPFAFERFHIVTPTFDTSVWTAKKSAEATNINYAKVKSLSNDVTCESLDQSLDPSAVTDLTIGWLSKPVKWLFSLRCLRRLTLTHKIDLTAENFASLLQNSPQLNSLTTPYQRLWHLTHGWENRAVCRELSTKIRSLIITADDYLTNNDEKYVSIVDLVPIIRVFHRRCHHLVISVNSRNLVAGVILKQMHHLRSLQVRLHDEAGMEMSKEWLNKQYPRLHDLNYTLLVNNNEYSFWFDQRQ